MTEKSVRKVFLLVAVILLIVAFSVVCTHNSNDLISQDANQKMLVGPLLTSGITSSQEPSCQDNSRIPKVHSYIESNPYKESAFRLYVTPEDRAVEVLAAQIQDAEDAYRIAVHWIYVSEQKLNQTADRWLTPHEFLADTPDYRSNPLKGKEVSDCEEQANTLVSLMRAKGIPPKEVRVALGEVRFNKVGTGHAWVELLKDGQWVALDPSWGPYWDDEAEKLVHRRGLPFDYYHSHTYPVTQIWSYYNDIYCLELEDGLGNAPVSWR